MPPARSTKQRTSSTRCRRRFTGFLVAHSHRRVEMVISLYRVIDRVTVAARRRARTLMKNIVYFDLETQKSAEEVGGWGNISGMGMSIGVIYSISQGSYK